jgi:hypothetical protein
VHHAEVVSKLVSHSLTLKLIRLHY